jgi:hypothetical protein
MSLIANETAQKGELNHGHVVQISPESEDVIAISFGMHARHPCLLPAVLRRGVEMCVGVAARSHTRLWRDGSMRVSFSK